MITNDQRTKERGPRSALPRKSDRATGAGVVCSCVDNAIHEGIHFHWSKLYQGVANTDLADPGFYWPTSQVEKTHLVFEVHSTGPCLVEFYEDASLTDGEWLSDQAINNRRIFSGGGLNSSEFEVIENAGSNIAAATKLYEVYIGRTGIPASRFPGQWTNAAIIVAKPNTAANPQLHYYLKCTSKENANNISVILGWSEWQEDQG